MLANQGVESTLMLDQIKSQIQASSVNLAQNRDFPIILAHVAAAIVGQHPLDAVLLRLLDRRQISVALDPTELADMMGGADKAGTLIEQVRSQLALTQDDASYVSVQSLADAEKEWIAQVLAVKAASLGQDVEMRLHISEEERLKISLEQNHHLGSYLAKSEIHRVMSYDLLHRPGRSVAEYDPGKKQLIIDAGLAARAPEYKPSDPDSQKFQALINEILRRALALRAGHITRASLIHSNYYNYFRQNSQELELFKAAVKKFGLDVGPVYLEDLERYASTTYPAELVIADGERQYDKIPARKWQRLEGFLKTASQPSSISYELVDRKGQSIAVYDVKQSKLFIDKGLAAVIPGTSKAQKHTQRAFQVFINDIFAHAALYAKNYEAKQVTDRWPVWRARAESYKTNPEHFLLLMDVLTSGRYQVMGNQFQGFGLKPVQMETTEEHYLRILRMANSLREFKKTEPHHPYFHRFAELQAQLPFAMPIVTDWAISVDEVEQIKGIFTKSAAQVKAINDQLVQQGKRLNVSVVVPIYREGIRLRPESPENPLGEDSLRAKIRHLDELFGKTQVDWELIYVSRNATDEHESGRVVLELLSQPDLRPYAHKVRLIDIPDSDPTLGKGSQVTLGMKTAITPGEGRGPADVVVYTDADAAIDLRQLGLVLGPIVLDGEGRLRLDPSGNLASNIIAGGSRFQNPKERIFFSAERFEDLAVPAGVDPLSDAEPDQVKIVTRKYVAEPFLYGPLTHIGIRDTQVGLRAFPRNILEPILPLPEAQDNKRFSFDTELLRRAQDVGGQFYEHPILWSDSPTFSTLQTGLGRWENFQDWIEQYRRLNRVHTLSEQDLQKIQEITIEAIAEAMQGRNTLPQVEKLREFVTRNEFADKYLSYPATLKVKRDESTVQKIAARESNLKKYLTSYENRYRLEMMEDRPVAVYDPHRRTILLDEALALMAPNFESGDAHSDSFQAFVHDIFRHMTGEANKFTRTQDLEYLQKQPGEVKKILEVITTPHPTIQVVGEEYSADLWHVMESQQTGASLGQRVEKPKAAVEQEAMPPSVQTDLAQRETARQIARALDVMKAGEAAQRLKRGIGSTGFRSIDNILFKSALPNGKSFVVIDGLSGIIDIDKSRLTDESYVKRLAARLASTIEGAAGQSVVLTHIDETMAKTIKDQLPVGYASRVLMTSESTLAVAEALANRYKPEQANIVVLYASTVIAPQAVATLGEHVYEVVYDRSDAMFVTSAAVKGFALTASSKLALYGAEAAKVLRQEQDLNIGVPESRVIQFNRSTLAAFVEQVLEAEREADALRQKAA